MTYQTVECKCGWNSEGVDDAVKAQVIADRHEASDVRRPYRHDTRIVEEVR